MRVLVLTAFVALPLLAAAPAHAVPGCGDDRFIVYSRLAFASVSWRVDTCLVVEDGDAPVKAGVRLIPPGTEGVVLNYDDDLGPSVPTLQARLVGRGIDQTFTLYRFSVGDDVLYGAGEKRIDPDAKDDLRAFVHLPGGSVAGVTYHDAGTWASAE